jgi:hypothetical protein
MARNGSGTYSLPAGNPVVTGTTISSTWANTTLSDIATALTASVANDGQTPILANQDFGGFNITNLGTVSGVTGTFTGTITGANFTASGSGGRFLADFTNSTHASRFLFKSSTVNGATVLGIIPNGTSITAQLSLYDAVDANNAGIVALVIDGSNSYISTSKTGTGTTLGFNIYTNAILALSISTSQICAFANSPTMPTAAPGTNNTQGATTAFVAAVDALALHKAGIETITGVKTFQAGSEPVGKNIKKAWCRFNGTTIGTNAPTAGFNVTSVTRNGLGDYTINFTVNMADANYSVSGMVGYSGNPGCWLNIARSATATPLAVGSARVLTSVSGSSVDAEMICVEIMANN